MEESAKEVVLIGSDIELGLIDPIKLTQIDAHTIYPDNFPGWGLDGHSDICELRTDLSGIGDPLHHIKSLERLCAKTIPLEVKKSPCRIVTGTMVGPDPLGGHIHFSAPKICGVLRNILYALDVYVALPLSMFEAPLAFKKRITTYGKLSACEKKSFDHFEYRTLPSFLVTPGIARGVFCLAYVVADEFYHTNYNLRIQRRSWVKKWYQRNSFKTGKNYLNPLFQSIKKMRLYPKYANWIASLFGLARVVKPWCVPQISYFDTFRQPIVQELPKCLKDYYYFAAEDKNIGEIVEELSKLIIPTIKVYFHGLKLSRCHDIIIQIRKTNVCKSAENFQSRVPSIKIINEVLEQRAVPDDTEILVGIGAITREKFSPSHIAETLACVLLEFSKLHPTDIFRVLKVFVSGHVDPIISAILPSVTGARPVFRLDNTANYFTTGTVSCVDENTPVHYRH